MFAVSLVSIFIFIFPSLFLWTSKFEFKSKLLIILISLVVLCFYSGFIYSLYGYTKMEFFYDEIHKRSISILDHSFLLSEKSNFITWIIYLFGIIGSIYHLKEYKKNPYAIGFLSVLITSLIFILYIYIYIKEWNGPRIAYIEIINYPFYCCFAILFCKKLIIYLKLNTYKNYFFSNNLFNNKKYQFFTINLLIILVISLGVILKGKSNHFNNNPFIWPPKETIIIEELKQNIGISQLDNTFKGRVVNIAGADFEKEWIDVPFINQHNFDSMALSVTGNDHRIYGLWYFGIPTIFDSNQFSSPFFHLINSRLLNNIKHKDTRTYETQSLINIELFKVLGVNHIITDKKINQKLLKYVNFNNGKLLYLYKLYGSNINGYSINKLIYHNSSNASLNWLTTSTSLNQEASTSDLLLTKNKYHLIKSSEIKVEKNGYTIKATSDGKSLILLPFEFTNCLEIISSSQSDVKLLRLNLALTGIEFNSKLDIHIQYIYNPLNYQCKLKDWNDANTLNLKFNSK